MTMLLSSSITRKERGVTNCHQPETPKVRRHNSIIQNADEMRNGAPSTINRSFFIKYLPPRKIAIYTSGGESDYNSMFMNRTHLTHK